MLIPFSAFALLQIVEEYQLKSAFIERVTRFITWPGQHNHNRGKTFKIGLAGENPFNGKLRSYFKDHKIKNRDVRIIAVRSKADIGKCDLIFVSESEKNDLDIYISQSRKFGILTVSDCEGFTEKGIHIGLLMQNKNIDLLINKTSLEESGFKVESLLLDYAKIVGGNNQ